MPKKNAVTAMRISFLATNAHDKNVTMVIANRPMVTALAPSLSHR